MGIKLITGLKAVADIQSEDDGARIYATISSGDKVLNAGEKFGYSIISNNCVRIKSGEILMQGRHVRQAPGTYTDLTIDNGTQGKKRNDIIVMRYTKESGTDLENAELAVLKGTPGEAAADPEITIGDIYTGCLIHEMALYRVSLNGLNIESVTQLFSELENYDSTLPISRGGTGATTAEEARANLGVDIDSIYPIGSIYMSVSNINPSALFGGVWIRWGNGRVPVGVSEGDSDFSAAEKTGGHHAVTIEERHLPMSVSTDFWRPRGESGAYLGNGEECWATAGATHTHRAYGQALSVVQPYITCYMWLRTA